MATTAPVDFKGEIPPGITREHVLLAMKEWENGNRYDFGDSIDYDLLYESKRYPPKAILGIAARSVIGRALKPSEFASGKESACFRQLESLGFVIGEKLSPTVQTSLPPDTPSIGPFGWNTPIQAITMGEKAGNSGPVFGARLGTKRGRTSIQQCAKLSQGN